MSFNAFRSVALERITIPASITLLSSGCFHLCGELVEITFKPPSSLNEICEYAFQKSGIVSIVFPRSLRILPKYAFLLSERLESVTFENRINLPSFDEALLCGPPSPPSSFPPR
jgi:hypothetical protein